MTVEPIAAPRGVLSKHLFGSPWSPRRLLLRAPRVIAIFSFRYDAHLVPDLIENLRPIVDGYVAYDDRGASEAYTDERTRKAMLREAAREMGAQWLLCIDPDERLEMAAAECMRAMTGVIEPVAWRFALREMYTPTAYRVDGPWTKKSLACLFPLLEGQVFSDAPLHGRRSPLNTEYEKRDSGLNLYHLKMIDAERRKARRDFYKALDPANAFQKIGYDYLADETGLVLEEVPASRLYRPLYREDGGIWQPDLAALQPIAVSALRETGPNPPEQAGGRAKSTPMASVQARANSPLRKLARNALGAVARAFPEALDRVALLALSQLGARPLRDRVRAAKFRALLDQRMPQEPRRNRGKGRQSGKKDRVPDSIAQRIQAVFTEAAADFSAEDRIVVMRALRRLDLLSDWAFHVQLTRLFAERRMELVRSLVDDDSLGFDIVRDFHRARLSAYFGDASVTLAEIQDLHRRAKESFLEEPALNEFLIRCIKQGDADAIPTTAIESSGTRPVEFSDDVVAGACHLLIAKNRHRVAAQLLERHWEQIDDRRRLGFLEPLFRLDEAGALSPSLSAYCASFRPDVGAKAIERLAEVYIGVDDVDRAQFDRHIIAKLRALEAVKPNLIDIRFSAQQRRSLIETILTRLAERQPLSLIRLNDGESYVFPIPEVEGIERKWFEDDHSLRERHWWGVSPPPEVRSAMRYAVCGAVEKCDIVGLPSVYRVLQGFDRMKVRYGKTDQQRGLMTVLAAAGGTIPLAGKIVTEERCQQCAFDRTALEAMVSAAQSVLIVSCWPEQRLRFPADRVKYIAVPPQEKVIQLTGAGGEPPIFTCYREIAAKVRAESGPGTLVLVGAGIVGKLFVGEAKQAGAVALDVGSLLDYMAGYHTRLLADAPSLIY